MIRPFLSVRSSMGCVALAVGPECGYLCFVWFVLLLIYLVSIVYVLDISICIYVRYKDLY